MFLTKPAVWISLDLSQFLNIFYSLRVPKSKWMVVFNHDEMPIFLLFVLIFLCSDTALDKLLKADDEDQDGDDDELEISQDDGAASSWLQSMGLDKQSFPTLEPSKVNLYPFNIIIIHATGSFNKK